MSAKIVDMTGKRYGRLRALSLVGPGPSRGMIWSFACDCGRRFNASGNEVRRGGITQCPECATASRVRDHSTHGMSKSDEYRIWMAIKNRCLNPNAEAYEYYGGRGIKICERWRVSFLHFMEDMGMRPTKKHTVERVNNDGNYDPKNCVWATRKEQSNNKRNNRIICIGGLEKTLAQWAHETGINEATIRARIMRGDTGQSLIRKLQK